MRQQHHLIHEQVGSGFHHSELPKVEMITETAADALRDASPFSKQVGGTHYKSMTLQPITYILANDLGFMEGCIVKYVTRYKQKGGIEDLKKVIHYAEMLIAHVESQGG